MEAKVMLEEIQQVVLRIEAQSLKQPSQQIESFIDYYYQQEEALILIKEQLLSSQRPLVLETNEGQKLKRMAAFLRERETNLLSFYDWGDPIAVSAEKEATFLQLKKVLSE